MQNRFGRRSGCGETGLHPVYGLGKRCAMKERVKNGSLFVLAIIGILLIAFSLYGMLSQLWAKWGDSSAEDVTQTTSTQAETTQEDAPQTETPASAENTEDVVPEEEMYRPGDNPDIDAAIREELNRILNETAFSYHNDTGRNKGYAGEHRASFTNQTDVDFGTIQLEISLYKLDNPRQYGDDATIPDEPLEVHNAYVGPLAAGETVPLSFTSDTDDYNYFLFGYGYTLEE